MFLRPAYYRHPEFRRGASDLLAVAPGFAAWGLMTGVAMVNAGMSGFEAVLMTVLVYAGSAQLAAIPLLVAGAPMWVILAAAFCVNLRFVVFSAHLRAYMMHLPRLERLVTGFLTTDLTYVMFVQRFPVPGRERLTGWERLNPVLARTSIVPGSNRSQGWGGNDCFCDSLCRSTLYKSFPVPGRCSLKRG